MDDLVHFFICVKHAAYYQYDMRIKYGNNKNSNESDDNIDGDDGNDNGNNNVINENDEQANEHNNSMDNESDETIEFDTVIVKCLIQMCDTVDSNNLEQCVSYSLDQMQYLWLLLDNPNDFVNKLFAFLQKNIQSKYLTFSTLLDLEIKINQCNNEYYNNLGQLCVKIWLIMYSKGEIRDSDKNILDITQVCQLFGIMCKFFGKNQ